MPRFSLSCFCLPGIIALAAAQPLSALDANGDGLEDLWCQRHNIAPFTGSQDLDGDGRINLVESINLSDPRDVYFPDTGLGMVYIADQNADGLDDGWQIRYNISGAQALDDPDGDQRTNLEESIVASNPFVSDTPWSGVGSAQPAAGPGEFSLLVPQTIPGLRYTLQTSVDMMQWSAASIEGNPGWGNGGARADTCSTGGAPWMFFRYVIDDPHSDGDQLSDYFETQILGTDPLLDDSDGDGTPDGQEYLEATNPTDPDSVLPPVFTLLYQYYSVWNEWGQLVWPPTVTGGGRVDWSTDTDYFYDEYEIFEPRWAAKWAELDFANISPLQWSMWGPLNSPDYIPWASSVYDYRFYELGGDVTSEEHEVYRRASRYVVAADRKVQYKFKAQYMELHRLWDWAAIPPELIGVAVDPQLVTLALSPGEQTSNVVELIPPEPEMAYGLKIELIPIEFVDEEACSGLDTLSPQSWLMVPQDGENSVFALTGASEEAPVGFKVAPEGLAYLDVQPAVTTGDVEVLTVSGGAPVGDGEGLVVGVGESFTTEQVLRFSVKLRQQLKVAVHPITLVDASGAVLETPQHTPAQGDLQEYLNMTFGDQANIFCDVVVTAGASVNWDVGVGVGGSTYGAGNRHFEILKPTLSESDEENAVTAAVHDPTAHVNIYFIAATPIIGVAGGMWTTNISGSETSPVLGFAGKAERQNNGNIFVWDYPSVSDQPHHMWAMAHEIGHFVGGLMHTDIQISSNPSYLPGTDNELRLMNSKEGAKRATSPRMLIKAEWDKLQNFFQ